MSRQHLPSGLKVKDMTEGTGAVAERGKLVTIHYRGFLNRGDQFRSSYDDGAPISFVVGLLAKLLAFGATPPCRSDASSA